MDWQEEDNQIGLRMRSLQTLPDGYVPDLQSKWAIIEAGLDRRPRYRGILGWVAAMIVMTSIGFCVMQSDLFSKKHTVITPVHIIPSNPKPIVKSNEALMEPTPVVYRRKHPLKKSIPMIIADVAVKDTVTTNIPDHVAGQPIAQLAPPGESLPQAAMKPKKRQYRTLDFGTQEAQRKDQPVFASGPSRFKIHLFQSDQPTINQSEQTAPESILLLRRDF